MAKTKTYPVKSRLRHSGTVYQPGGENAEIELTEKEAAPLLALKTISDPVADFTEVAAKAAVDLVTVLKALMNDGKDIPEMNMDDIKPLLGKDHKDAKRADVNAALDEIAKNADGGSD